MDIKELLGNDYQEGMTIEQINSALSSKKLVDLSTGDYVSKGKMTDAEKKAREFEQKYNELKTQHMSDEEKQKAASEELANRMAEQEKQIARYKMKESLIDSGFNSDEIKLLMENNSPETYAKISKARLENQEKELQAKFLKNDPKLQGGNPNKPEKKFMDYTMEELNALKVSDPDTYNKLLNE